MIARTKQAYYKYQKFVHYVAIGVIGIGVDVGIFLILFNILGVPAVPANLISGSLAITNNFLWNAKFNFKKTDQLLKRFISFSTIGVIGMLITTAILYIAVNMLGMNANIVKLVVQAIVISVQFNLNKKVSFRD
jgi:putative flippase GtrA